jgi:hypothetical protein
MFFVLMLIAFLALAINIGRIMRTRGDLQNAADSAALAAAERLLGADGDLILARDVAKAQATTFKLTSGASADVADADVHFGFWHFFGSEPCVFAGGTCGAGFEQAPYPGTFPRFSVNAIRVTARATLPTIFDAFMQQGNTSMAASGIALSRRARANCSLPVAIPTCRATDDGGNPLFDSANGELDCTSGPKTVTFTSGRESWPQDPDNTRAFGRVDIVNYGDDDYPISNVYLDSPYMRHFVRNHTLDNDAECMIDQDYEVGITPMPQWGTPRPNLEPLVEGLLGLRIDPFPAAPTLYKSGPCTLGQRRVVAVLKSNSCGDENAWPPTTSGMVVGYVNITFQSIRCSDGTTILDTSNCDNAALALPCTTPVWEGSPLARYSGQLTLTGQIDCAAPTGPNNDSTLASQPRLIQ